MNDAPPDRITLAQYRDLVASGQAAKVVRRRSEEEDLQIACFSLVVMSQAAHPILRWMYHPPNGGGRSKATAGRLRAMGVRSGVPDLLCHMESGRWKGFAVEAKSAIGRLSEDQIDWLIMFKQRGYLVGLFRTIDEFSTYLQCYVTGVDVPHSLSADQYLTKKMRLTQFASRQSRFGHPDLKDTDHE